MSTRTERLERGLRAWIRTHDAHVRAAVLLLIEHAHWLRDADFVRSAVKAGPDDSWIVWGDAAEVLERSKCSSTEHAVLSLAIALATDRYRLSRMGTANSSAIARAVAAAAGVQLEPEVVMAGARR